MAGTPSKPPARHFVVEQLLPSRKAAYLLTMAVY